MKLTIALIALVVGCASQVSYGQSQGRAPTEVQQELEYFVGDWVLEGSVEKQPIKGKASFHWGPGKYCLLGSVEFVQGDTPQSFCLVAGWDSSTGWYTEQGVASDGTVYTLRWKRKDANTSEGEETSTLAGKSATAHYVAEKQRPDKFTARRIPKAGSEETEWTLRYTRAVATPARSTSK